MVEAYLELIAAKAKILAQSYKNNQLWPGELRRGLDELSGAIEQARQQSRDNDYGDR